MNRELLGIMKIWTKDPIKRVQLIERIRKLVDDSNKKRLKAAEHSLIVNNEMETTVSLFYSISISYLKNIFVHTFFIWLFVKLWFLKMISMVLSGKIQR